MSIWFKPVDIAALNEKGGGCANGNLGIEILRATEEGLEGRMPVDRRTKQPAGVLHGGASVMFAETLASWAGAMAVDPEKFHCVGIEINANHVRAASGGYVHGNATPAHIGRTLHVWDVSIKDDDGRLVCASRVTLAILDRPSGY